MPPAAPLPVASDPPRNPTVPDPRATAPSDAPPDATPATSSPDAGGPALPAAPAVGDRVTVTQQIQNKGWTTSVTGTVQAAEQRKTGSWFAHARDDRLWLDRLVLRKDDGEVVVCNLDAYSRVEPAPKVIEAD